MMELKPDQLRRSPDGTVWRVLGLDCLGRREPAVGLERLTGPIRGLGWFQSPDVVRGWRIVESVEAA